MSVGEIFVAILCAIFIGLPILLASASALIGRIQDGPRQKMEAAERKYNELSEQVKKEKKQLEKDRSQYQEKLEAEKLRLLKKQKKEIETEREQLQKKFEDAVRIVSEKKAAYEDKEKALQEELYNLSLEYEERMTDFFSCIQNIDVSKITVSLNQAQYLNTLETGKLMRALSSGIRISDLRAQATIDSLSDDGKSYQVSLESCTCESFQHSHGKPCKHMIALAANLGFLARLFPEMQNTCNHALREAEQKLHEVKQAEKNKAIQKRAVEKEIEANKELLNALDEKVQTYPFLAELIANFREAQRDVTVRSPADKRILTAAIKRADKENAILRNQIAVYEYMFPILEEFKNVPPQQLADSIREAGDTGFQYQWLSEDEYAILDDSEKQELWLKRYFRTSKNAWEAGIKYERYIGYLCEMRGYKVKYTGALLKLNDMGRDLIVSKGNSIYIIQCKRFKAEREIHENHLFQLFGTTVHYAKENQEKKVFGVFVTTSSLSAVAKECADLLNIQVYQGVEFAEYPIIKCNIGKDGERIFHLPFDQQYDTAKIQISKGEFYASTITEAEKNGFRHAMKHFYVS